MDINEIWTNFHKELKIFINGKVRHSADSDDILQDVFVKMLVNIDKVNNAENIRGYIYGIVRNSISDYFKSRKFVVSETEDFDVELNEDESNDLNEKVAECCIKPFIEKLPEHYREALLVTEFMDVSQKELAERLGISYSGAKSRVQRGKEKLKDMILACCEYESDAYGNLMNSREKDCSCPRS